MYLKEGKAANKIHFYAIIRSLAVRVVHVQQPRAMPELFSKDRFRKPASTRLIAAALRCQVDLRAAAPINRSASHPVRPKISFRIGQVLHHLRDTLLVCRLPLIPADQTEPLLPGDLSVWRPVTRNARPDRKL